MFFLIILIILTMVSMPWLVGSVLINELGSHAFVLVTFFTLCLVLLEEVRKKRISVFSFPVLGSFFFILGAYGPYYNLEIKGLDIFYVHLNVSLIPDGVAYASVCYASIWLGYYFPSISNSRNKNKVLIFQPKSEGFWRFVIIGLTVIWITSAFVYLGGVEKLWYNDRPRAFNQFTANDWTKNMGLMSRLLAPILAFLSVLLLYNHKDRKLPLITWVIIVFWFFYSLSQFDRGRFLEVSISVIIIYVITAKRVGVLELRVISVIILMTLVVLVGGNGRAYHETGLSVFFEAVSYGVDTKVKDPFSIFPEVGSLVMTTSAIQFYNSGITTPATDIFYQINPLPSFLLPDAWKPQRFMEKLLGTYGHSGTPMPLMAFSYMSFGIIGAGLFAIVGRYFRWIDRKVLMGMKLLGEGRQSAFAIFIYPISIASVMYIFMHGEPRGSIRFVLYSIIVLYVLKLLFPSQFKTVDVYK